jgi:hypothetical protein
MAAVAVVVAAVAATAVVAAMGVSPPTPLPPKVCGPPTSTPGLAPFRCGRVSRGRCPAASPASIGYAGRCSSLWSSTAGRATLHATTHASAHSSWSTTFSSTAGSGGVVPMDGLVGSIVVGQLLQHHVHGPSYSHRLGG